MEILLLCVARILQNPVATLLEKKEEKKGGNYQVYSDELRAKAKVGQYAGHD